ncbi:MAG TPA: POTRA domain-containing protein [Vicinamibacterales bacterium]|nr:POTRA domain-containing protein [Vicinamibacterales bacterium]
MRLPVACLFVLLAAAPPAAQSAAGRYVGRTVEQVQIYIETNRVEDPALLDLIEVQPGQPLAMSEVRESIAHLYGLGRFQDVQVVGAAGVDGGVHVRFDLIPVHVVQRVEFRGNDTLPEGRLRGAVIDRHGAAPAVGRIQDVALTLERVYADEGFLRAAIRPEAVELHDPDRTLLTFHVTEGPRATVQSIEVRGNPRIPEPELLRRLDLRVGQPYQRARIQGALDRYVTQLQDRGFYRAIGALRPEVLADATAVALTIDVDAGPAVRLQFEGDPIPEGRRRELVPVQQERSVDEDLLEDAEAAIRRYLLQQGYWKANVTRREEGDEDTLRIVFTVQRGPQYRLADDVEIRGNQAVPLPDLRALIPLKPGELFVDSELTTAASAIRALYLRRGFVAIALKPGVTETDPAGPGQGRIRAEIVIVEGPRTAIREVRLEGNGSIAEPLLRSRLPPTLGPGNPLYEPAIVEGRDALLLEYLNEGFASAAIQPRTVFSDDRTQADLIFAIQEGPQTLVDHILIVGNAKTDPDVILNALEFRSGDPFGFTARLDSQRNLTELGLFRRVRITELTHGTGNEHDVLVTVEEAAATTIGYGGGVEATQVLRATGAEGEAREELEFAPRGFFDITRRNLGGRNRSVSLYTRVALRPDDVPDDPERDGTGVGFREYRVVGTYRAPQFVAASDLTITGALEQAKRASFSFSRRGANIDVQRRFLRAMLFSGRYSFSRTRTFDERLSDEDQATIDRLFPQVRLSGFSGALSRDTRDELLSPQRGGFLSIEGAMAARSLGGQVGFVKTYMQGFWFRRLPGSRPVVFATRAAVGLADGFPREVSSTDPDGTTRVEVIEDLPASERFFAGGDTTIRGYALDSVGAPNTITPAGFPTGGNAVLILNGELRMPVWRDFGTALFVDGGNVFRRVMDFDVGELRGSVGFGVRYISPIGPLRLDLGFKLDRREIGGALESRTALHFSFGQAF